MYFVESVEYGGSERALLHLLGNLDRQRWQPVLFHPSGPGLAPLIEEARSLGVSLQAVTRMEGRQVLVGIPRFARALRAERPAVFHAFLHWPLACKYGLLMAALARVPAVVASAQLFLEGHRVRSVYAQHRIVASGVHRYIAVSHDVARRLQQSFRLPGRKIRVIHNGVPLAPHPGTVDPELRARLTRGTSRPIVLTPARLHEQKGHKHLLEAAALVPEATFVLAGDGPERPRLEAQARGLGIANRIVFLGYRRDVPDLLASCHVCVLPSLNEGLPLALLEAMAAGKPVVSSAIGGVDEVVVQGEGGLLVPPAEPAALAAAIRSLLSDPGLATRLAAAGRARVQRDFSAETMTRRIAEVYAELLPSPRERDAQP